MKRLPLVMVTLCLISGFTLLQDDGPPIEQLIHDLGSTDFQVRERAEKELKKIGPAAESALRKAAEDADLERSTRAKRILDGMAKRTEMTPTPKDDGILTLTEADSVSIAITDGKIRVEVTHNGAKEVYEAANIEQFREKYPEIAKKYGLNIIVTPSEKEEDPLVVPDPPDIDSILKEFEAMKRRLDDRFDDGAFRDLERMLRDLPGLRPEIPSSPLTPPSERETAKRAFGVRVIPCAAELRAQLDLDEDEGVVISEVVPGSTAETAGLKEHDVILSVNGNRIGDILSFAEVMRQAMAGDEIALDIVRGGGRNTVKVKTEKQE